MRGLSSQRILPACLALCIAFMALAGLGLERSLEQASGSAGRVSDATKALIANAQFRTSVASMAAAERGFLLSRDPTFLSERDQAQRAAESALRKLAVFVAGDSAQAARVAQMAHQFHADVAALSADGGSAATRWRQFMAQAAAAAEEVDRAERTALSQRRSADEERQRDELMAAAFAFIAFAVLTAGVCAALYLESRQRRRSEARLAEIVEGLPVTVWQRMGHADPRGKFLYIGRDCLQERGVAADVLIARAEAAVDNILPEDREAVARVRDAAGQTLALDHTYRVQVQDRVRWIHSHARGRPADDGSIRWTGYWADVTEQKEMERRLHEAIEAAQRANDAKSNFLAVMSHEMRTPLNGMLGLLELLALTEMAPQQRTRLAVAAEAGNSLSRLIDDVLDLSRAESGRLQLHPVPAAMEAMVWRVCQLHHAVALGRGLQLEWSVDPQLSAALVFDPVRVGQVLNNFLANALKFTPSGSVRITAQRVGSTPGGERVRLSVTDTGIGIAPDDLPRIFEPYFQSGASTYDRYGGSGLGLAICQQLAHAMGGEVRMRSTQGEGTEAVFEAEFPLAAALPADGPAAPGGTRAAPPDLRQAPSVARAERCGTLVLVVDDHPVNRELLVHQLASLGYAAIAAEDGISALQLWSTRAIGLVLCDCNMPGMDGFGLTRAIRAREQAAGTPRVPILACTARASEADRQHCLDAGMDACLVKPIGRAGLAQHLARWLPLAVDALADAAPVVDTDDVLASFAVSHDHDLALLATAVTAEEWPMARLIAHRMAGAAAMIGAADLAESCFAVEDAARLGHAPTVEVELDELRRQTACFAPSLPATLA